MLVLSRKAGEGILIGPDIEITVLDIRGDVIKIGIAAPKDLRVWRKELLEGVTQENVRAAKATIPAELGRVLRKR